MTENNSSNGKDVAKLSRRGLLTLGTMLAGVGGLGTLSGTASAHGLMAFRDAFIGNDGDEEGLGSKGWLFFAKDTGNVYYHNGNSWQEFPIDSGELSDTDSDGLLEAPEHDGIDVKTVEADEIHLGADQDGDESEWRLDADSTDTARFYSWDGSTETEYLRLNEGGPLGVKKNLQMNGNSINMGKGGNNIYGLSAIKAVDDSLGSDFLIRSRGDGSSRIALRDEANVQDLLIINEGGPVEVNNSPLSLAHEQSSAPSAPSSGAKLWVDSEDGNLKATFADETTSTVATK